MTFRSKRQRPLHHASGPFWPQITDLQGYLRHRRTMVRSAPQPGMSLTFQLNPSTRSSTICEHRIRREEHCVASSTSMMRTDVYDQLKERLFTGELRTGQFVSQRELTSLLGATLNPVREAIRKLEIEGLINVYPQRGIQIIEGGPKAINDAYEYRQLLELNAVRHFAAAASDDGDRRADGEGRKVDPLAGDVAGRRRCSLARAGRRLSVPQGPRRLPAERDPRASITA